MSALLRLKHALCSKIPPVRGQIIRSALLCEIRQVMMVNTPINWILRPESTEAGVGGVTKLHHTAIVDTVDMVLCPSSHCSSEYRGKFDSAASEAEHKLRHTNIFQLLSAIHLLNNDTGTCYSFQVCGADLPATVRQGNVLQNSSAIPTCNSPHISCPLA